MLRIWMANRFSKIGVLIFVWVLTVGSVPAQSGETVADPSLVTKEKLEAVQAEIESLRAQAARLSAQENSVLAVLGQYDVEAQIRIREIGLIDLKQKKTQEDIAILESQLRELQKNLEQQKAYLNRRLVEAYKQGEMNYLKLLLQVNSAADLARSYQYIAFLAKDDQRRIQQYRALFNEVEQTRLRLEQENRNLSLLRQDSEEAYRALLGSKQEKVRLLGAIQDQKEMHLSALSDLRLAAGQLQGGRIDGFQLRHQAFRREQVGRFHLVAQRRAGCRQAFQVLGEGRCLRDHVLRRATNPFIPAGGMEQAGADLADPPGTDLAEHRNPHPQRLAEVEPAIDRIGVQQHVDLPEELDFMVVFRRHVPEHDAVRHAEMTEQVYHLILDRSVDRIDVAEQ